jgi:hypothetical protein
MSYSATEVLVIVALATCASSLILSVIKRGGQ